MRAGAVSWRTDWQDSGITAGTWGSGKQSRNRGKRTCSAGACWVEGLRVCSRFTGRRWQVIGSSREWSAMCRQSPTHTHTQKKRPKRKHRQGRNSKKPTDWQRHSSDMKEATHRFVCVFWVWTDLVSNVSFSQVSELWVNMIQIKSNFTYTALWILYNTI